MSRGIVTLYKLVGTEKHATAGDKVNILDDQLNQIGEDYLIEIPRAAITWACCKATAKPDTEKENTVQGKTINLARERRSITTTAS